MTVRTSVSCISVCLILLLVYSTAAHADLFEGGPCKLHTGVWGVCKNARNCKWLIQNLQQKQMSYTDIIRCSFSDANEDIVCCGDDIPNKLQTSSIDSLDSTLIFEKNELVRSTTQRTIENVTPTIKTPSKVLGSRVIEACLKYSALAGPFQPWRIVNGQEAGLTEFPHMAALGYENTDKNGYDFDCGGSLIADQWVVTAAHCVRTRREPIIVRLGIIFLHNHDDGVDPIDRNVINIVRHPEYSLIRKKNDIALVQFTGSIDFTDLVRPACIYTDVADMPASNELTIAGWGAINKGNERTKRSEMLLKTKVNSVPSDQCNEKLVPYNKFLSLSNSQLCALNNQLDENPACQGDSGGPIFQYSPKTGISTVVGVISYGSFCGTALPGIYTRIAYYLDWIEKTVWP